MARKEDRHSQQHQVHYTTVLPSNSVTNGNVSKESSGSRKLTELERAKALYVDFDDGFQDDQTNHDYFGFQPPPPSSSSETTSQQNSDQATNFYLQSVETISEVKNTNFSPIIRYQASRENSLPSTPSDTPPYKPRHNHNSNQSSSNSSTPPIVFTSNSNSFILLDRDFTNLNLIESSDGSDLPPPFTPDAIRLKIKENPDDSLVISSQFKLILPQYFLVKYLGRSTCSELWGATAVRRPIDDMVQSARNLSSINELPTLEAGVNSRGLSLAHRHSPSQNKHNSRNLSPERNQHGLIPLDYISYVMHDVKYSKISACIVLRQSKTGSSDKKTTNEPVTECYTFLFQSKEHAHRFALALAEAFNTQKRSSRGAKHHHDDKKEGRSPQRRLKHHSNHHHDRTRVNRYDDSYLRDSEV